VREHQAILDAIRARDLGEADRLLEAHMDISAERLAEAEDAPTD
jgi:DNA-binding FadR family transcriptional regulator